MANEPRAPYHGTCDVCGAADVDLRRVDDGRLRWRPSYVCFDCGPQDCDREYPGQIDGCDLMRFSQ